MAWRSSVSSRGGCNLICTTDSGPDVCSSVKLIRCDEFLSWLWSKIDKGYDVIAMGTYSLLESNLVILFWHSCISHWPQKSQVFIFFSWTCAVSFYFLIHELNKTLAPVFNIYCAKLLLRVFFFLKIIFSHCYQTTLPILSHDIVLFINPQYPSEWLIHMASCVC